QIIAYCGQHITGRSKVQERGISFQILRRPDILEIASIRPLTRTSLSRTLSNDAFCILQNFVEIREGHRSVDRPAVLHLNSRTRGWPILVEQRSKLLAVR